MNVEFRKDKLMKIIDLSVPICNNPSEPMRIKVQRKDHEKGAVEMARNAQTKPFSGIKRMVEFVKYSIGIRKMWSTDFPQGKFITLDTVTLPTHMGTHIDAPYHFGPYCSNKKAKTIDELPVEWFYGNAIKLDLRHVELGNQIMKKDIIKSLEDIDYEIQNNDIVLIWTGMDSYWKKAEYFTKSSGMSREATEFLIDKGVHIIGIDAYGFDRSIPIMLDEYLRTKNEEVLWPAHMLGREKEYVHIERMTNFEYIPQKNFKISCFPLKLVGCDASWVRAVAIMEEENDEWIHRE